MRKDWEVKKLGDVCDIQNGFAFKSSLFKEQGLPILRISNIQNDTITLDNIVYFMISDYNINLDRFKVYPGDIVVALSGATTGKIGINRTDLTFYLNQRVALCRETDAIIKGYLFHYLRTKTIELLSMAGGVAQPNLSTNQIQQLTIPVPPLQVQQQIVEELDCLTSIIEKQKKQLEELDNLAQAIFYDMFGEPMENEKGWNIKKLEDIVHKNCTLSYGIVQPMEDVVDGVPIVRPIDLIDTFVSDTSLKRTRKEISNKYKRTILTGHEILLCVRGTTGIVSLVNESFAGYNVTRGIVPILLSSLYNRWFVYYQIKTSSIQQKISELTYGIALRQINIKDLRALTLITPPLSLQQQFASKIEAIEKQKELIKKSIKETEDLLNSRMDYYFN